MIGDAPITVFGETASNRAQDANDWTKFNAPVTLDNTEKALVGATGSRFIYLVGLTFVNTVVATTTGNIIVRVAPAGLTCWTVIQPNPAAPIGTVMGPFNFTQPIRTLLVNTPFTGQQSNNTCGNWVCYVDGFLSSV